MVQKECNCKTCSGVLPELDQENTTEVTEEEAKSIYKRLDDICNKVGNTPDAILLPELDKLLDIIDSIDDEILNLQSDVLSNPKELTQVRLGELSKKLY